jgi:outer membrane immunogenic protein
MRAWLSTAAMIALLMSSSAAFAADLRVRKAPPPAPMYTYNWTGFYIGGNLGGAWASGTLTDNFSGAENKLGCDLPVVSDLTATDKSRMVAGEACRPNRYSHCLGERCR